MTRRAQVLSGKLTHRFCATNSDRDRRSYTEDDRRGILRAVGFRTEFPIERETVWPLGEYLYTQDVGWLLVPEI